MTAMSQRRKVPENEPCAVCGDLATGYHYGVASCNGCKTFFRRTIVSEQTFVCQYDGGCDVNKNIRCACRHCRFNKCVAVGMDAKAIQNDRDRIGPTKRSKAMTQSDCDSPPMKRSPSFDSPGAQIDAGDAVAEQLCHIEKLCNRLRMCVIPDIPSAKEALTAPSLVYEAQNLPVENGIIMRELYPASMKDIQFWNKREMRLCLEWAKTFNAFNMLPKHDQFALGRNFAFTFNLMNRAFYSLNHGPDKIVFLNGAYILRQPQAEVRLPGCRPIYGRQMDEMMIPFREMRINIAEFAAFKAASFFNPDAVDLTPCNKPLVAEERLKYLSSLFNLIVAQQGITAGAQKYGNLLMMTSSIQNIIAQNEENMQVMDVFQNSWRIDDFVKELCMKEP